MLDLRIRREVKARLRRGQALVDVARALGVSVSSVKRIGKEAESDHLDDAAERRRRRIGRPSKVRRFRAFVVEILNREPRIRSAEVLRRVTLLGYSGRKTAIYALVASLRSEATRREVAGSLADATRSTGSPAQSAAELGVGGR